MKDFLNNPEYFKDCDPDKRAFLIEVIQNSSGITDKNMMMPYFKKVLQQCKEKNITFTQEEITTIITIMKQNATDEENAKIDKIISMAERKE